MTVQKSKKLRFWILKNVKKRILEHSVILLLTRFCKLLTTVAILSGHVPQVPQWHDTSGPLSSYSRRQMSTRLIFQQSTRIIAWALTQNAVIRLAIRYDTRV